LRRGRSPTRRDGSGRARIAGTLDGNDSLLATAQEGRALTLDEAVAYALGD
jgi:hypothetical protein